MAITYKLNNHRVSFHWNKDNDMWNAQSEDLNNLNLEAKSFNGMLKQLRTLHPELARSIRIFFPDTVKAVA